MHASLTKDESAHQPSDSDFLSFQVEFYFCRISQLFEDFCVMDSVSIAVSLPNLTFAVVTESPSLTGTFPAL